MAQVHVTLSRVDDRGDTGGSWPLITSVPVAKQTIPSSAANAVSTIAAAAADGLVWSVTATGNVFIKFGDAPDASTSPDHLILAGQTHDAGLATEAWPLNQRFHADRRHSSADAHCVPARAHYGGRILSCGLV